MAEIQITCKYCNEPILFELLEIKGEKLKVCMKKNCINQFAFDYPYPIDIYNKRIKKLFMDLAKSASNVSERFDPIPNGYNNLCLEEGSLEYIKFMNYLQIGMSNIMITEDVFQLSDSTGAKHSTFSSFSFDYSDSLSNNQITYLFHGSPFHNWHSIIRNGLKNYSGTNKMTSGAAYGNGMYFSDNLNISSKYSQYHKGKYIVGVFEVKKPDSYTDTENKIFINNESKFGDSVRDYYRKSDSIYVVSDEKCARLKYLVVIDNISDLTKFGFNLIKHFQACFNIQKDTKMKMNVLALKRLEREKNSLNKMFPGIIIETQNQQSWLCTFVSDDSLKNLIIKFPNDYPISAPELIVDSKIKHPNIIDGHLCMNELYNWKMNYCLDMVVLSAFQILDSIVYTTIEEKNKIWDEIKGPLSMIKLFNQ